LKLRDDFEAQKRASGAVSDRGHADLTLVQPQPASSGKVAKALEINLKACPSYGD
jgi:hypothetical protein